MAALRRGPDANGICSHGASGPRPQAAGATL